MEVLWKSLFKIKFHYAPCQKGESQEEIRKTKGESKRDVEERRHVYLHVFVVLFWKQIVQDKVEFRYKEQLENDFVKFRIQIL